MNLLCHPVHSRTLLLALALGPAACGCGSSTPVDKVPAPEPVQEGTAPSSTDEAGSYPRGSGTKRDSPVPAAPRTLPGFCGESPANLPLAAPAQAVLRKDGYVFVEGPVWSEKLNSFLFSEMNFNAAGKNGPPASIHQLSISEDGTAEAAVFIEESGSNGLAIDNEGLVACTHDQQSVSRYDLGSKKRSTLISDVSGKKFNSPNDLALHSAGHLYFTDPDWQIGKRSSETGVTGVYWRTPAGEITLVEGALKKPNGITLSPDETRLYVGAVDGTISSYSLLADGSLGERSLFAQVEEPDGMAVDCAGNLYVTSHSPGRVIVFSPDGKELTRIEVAPRTTNVAFGGPDRRLLLITAGTGVYTVATSIPGFPY